MLLGKLFSLKEKNYKKIPVNGISFDSRKVKKKDIFFAIDGIKTSGSKFIAEALSKGASAVVCEKKDKLQNFNNPMIIVKDVRKSLSETCSKFYKKKTKKNNCSNRNKWKVLCCGFFLSNIETLQAACSFNWDIGNSFK